MAVPATAWWSTRLEASIPDLHHLQTRSLFQCPAAPDWTVRVPVPEHLYILNLTRMFFNVAAIYHSFNQGVARQWINAMQADSPRLIQTQADKLPANTIVASRISFLDFFKSCLLDISLFHLWFWQVFKKTITALFHYHRTGSLPTFTPKTKPLDKFLVCLVTLAKRKPHLRQGPGTNHLGFWFFNWMKISPAT